MGRPMTEIEKKALENALKGPNGFLTGYRVDAQESTEQARRMGIFYYGVNPETDTYEQAWKRITELIPSAFENRPATYPEKATLTAINSFKKRSVPAFMGMLAEIALNNDVTLDELADTTSPEAKAAKIRAGEYLREKLPKKDENGNWVFDYEGFVDFFHDNAVILQQKLYALMEDLANKSIYEQYKICSKYETALLGLFDGYNQQFDNSSFIPDDHEKKDMIRMTSIRNQFLCSYMNLVLYATREINEADLQAGGALDVDIYAVNQSCCNLRRIQSLTHKAFETDASFDELYSNYEKLQDSKKVWVESDQKIGMLSRLTDFERNVLAMDEELTGKVVFKYKPNALNQIETGDDIEMCYMDNEGNELSLQDKDDPKDYDLNTLAKIRYEINQVLLKPKYADYLMANGYSMDEINYFQGLEPLQRAAYMQCEDTINALTDAYKQMSEGMRAELEAGERVAPQYVALMNQTMATVQKFENLVANPDQNNIAVISQAVEELQNACEEYQAGVGRKASEPEAHWNLSNIINQAAADYAVIKDRMVDAIKSDRVREIRKDESFTDFEKVLLKAAEGIEWPQGMSEDEYMAVVVGAFLGSDVIHQLNQTGDLADEKAWSSMLNDILAGADVDDENVTNAINTARQNASRALQEYAAGNKAAAHACIKDFIRVSERLYDKNRIFENNAGRNTIASEMLALTADLVSMNEYKSFTNLENTLRKRREIDAGVMSIVKAGDEASAKVLEDSVTIETRKEVVLDILTKAYLNVQAQEKKAPKNISASARLRAALAQKGVKLEPEVNNDANLAEMSDTVNHFYDMSRISALEANFVGTNINGKSAKDEFTEHIRAELEHTDVYRLLMQNETALQDVALNGIASDIFNGGNLESLKNIKYLRTNRDIDNTVGVEEYNNQMDDVIASLSNRIELKNELVRLAKEEVAGRAPIDYNKSIFAQYTVHIGEVLSAHRDRLVGLGGPTEKIDELITKIYEHTVQMNNVFSKQIKPMMMRYHTEITNRLNDIEQLYKDVFAVDFEMVDSPLDLLRAERAMISKYVSDVDQEDKALNAGQKIAEKDRINFKKELATAINEYNVDKLVRAYSDVVSKEYLRATTYPAVITLIDRLNSAKKDDEFQDEYKTVVKGAQYLKAIVKQMTAADKPDALTPEDFEVYKDAVEALEQKVTAYEQKAALSSSARRIAVDDVRAYLNGVVPRLDQAGEVYHAQAEDEKRKEMEKLRSMIPSTLKKQVKSAIESSIAFEENNQRRLDNFYKIFGEKMFAEGDTWVAQFGKRFMKPESDYTADESFGYSKKDFAIIAGVIAFSETLCKMTNDEIMNECGTTYTDIFIERVKDAIGDDRLGEFATNAKLKMNELIGEMKQGNYQNVGKLFKEGLRIVLANGVGVYDYSLMKPEYLQQHRILKDVADFLDKHPQFHKIATEHLDGVEDLKPEALENMRNFQKFGPVMDEFAAALGRVGRYLRENLDQSTVTLAANSDIARDVAYVMAYLRFSDTETDEKNISLADANAKNKVLLDKYLKEEEAIQLEIKNTNARIVAIERHEAQKLKAYQLDDLSEKELVEAKKVLEGKLETLNAHFTEVNNKLSQGEMSFPLHYDMFPKCVAKMGLGEFQAKVEAEKTRLFEGKETRQLTVNELAGMTVDIKHALTHGALKNTFTAEPAEFHKSSVVKFYDNSIDILRAMQTTAQDEKTAMRIKSFTDRLEYIATRLKRFETPLEDGSYLNFSKELEDGIHKVYENLKKLAGELVVDKNAADLYVKQDTYNAFDGLNKHINKAIDNDIAALQAGKLYGATEIHNMKKQIKAIDRIGNALALSKSFGDGSSPEFKAMLNDLESLKREYSQTKRTDGGVTAYVSKIEKLRESAKEYLRHKRISNNGRSKSLNRIARTKELIECIDGIMPEVKAEAKANSYASRFEKKDYSKDKVAEGTAILAKIDDKRNEIEVLSNGVYKDVCKMGLAARERLMDLVIKDDLDSDSADTREEIKHCIATLILEKRLQYERLASLKQLGLGSPYRLMQPVFTEQFQMAKKAAKAKQAQPVEPVIPAENQNVVENINNIEMNLSINALMADRYEPPKNMYEKAVDQIVNYNFISDEQLQPDKIKELLVDENKEVEAQYLSKLHDVVKERNNIAQEGPKHNGVNRADRNEANVGVRV